MADHEHGRRNGSARSLSSCRKLRQMQRETRRDRQAASPLSWGDNAVARAVGRLPARVHVKLLVAFVGTARAGRRRRPARAASPRSVERQSGTARSPPEARLLVRQAPERRVPCASAARRERRTRRSTRSGPAGRRSVAGHRQSLLDRGRPECARTHRARHASRQARVRAACRGRARSCVEIRRKSGRSLGADARHLEHPAQVGSRRGSPAVTEPSCSPWTSTGSPRCSPMPRRRRPTT